MWIIRLNTTASRAAIARGIGRCTVYRAAIAEIAIAAVLQRLLTEVAAAGAVVAHSTATLWLSAAQAHGTTVDAMARGVHTQLANAIRNGLAG